MYTYLEAMVRGFNDPSFKGQMLCLGSFPCDILNVKVTVVGSFL